MYFSYLESSGKFIREVQVFFRITDQPPEQFLRNTQERQAHTGHSKTSNPEPCPVYQHYPPILLSVSQGVNKRGHCPIPFSLFSPEKKGTWSPSSVWQSLIVQLPKRSTVCALAGHLHKHGSCLSSALGMLEGVGDFHPDGFLPCYLLKISRAAPPPS